MLDDNIEKDSILHKEVDTVVFNFVMRPKYVKRIYDRTAELCAQFKKSSVLFKYDIDEYYVGITITGDRVTYETHEDYIDKLITHILMEGIA
jgi:hypothetical protein